MASLNMGTSDPLNNETIDLLVSSRIGNYALGYVYDGTFYPQYVGRSDSDLNDRLKDHVGDYKRFKFSYVSSVLAAWRKECENYHDFKSSLDNEIHPARPAGYSKENYPCKARVTCDE